MSRKIKDIKDRHTRELVYPRTHASAVVWSSDSTLEDIVEVKQDKLVSGTNIKTINGSSILGSGNITISGGSSSGGGSGVYPEVNHGTSDTTFTLTSNTFHVWDEVSELTLTLGDETAGVANEFVFQFTSGSEPTALTLPDNIKWVNGTAPTITDNMIYQVSVLKGLAVYLEFDNAISLVENKATLSNDGSKYIVTLQYAAASDVSIKVRTPDGPINGNITVGAMSCYIMPVAPLLDPTAYIENIVPNVDKTYNYTW